jgi:VIT1/CCC1 family predicted Fe2+/Mn2+ transporter
MTAATQVSKRVLDPHERISEVLFGLIMVLTFTGSISVAEASRENVRAILIAALGCNIAWGIIDAVLYLLGCLAEKGRNAATLRAVRASSDPQKAHRFISGALPPLIASVLQHSEMETIRQRLSQLPEPESPARLNGRDWYGALGVFVLVFFATLPVALPFIAIQNHLGAMRVSNAIAVVMLFIAGAAYGRCIGRSPWVIGGVMVALGLVLVGLTMTLGG